MGFVWSTALKDLQQRQRDPVGVALWLGIPLLVGALIIMASGGRSGPQPQAHVLVADRDQNFLSQLLVGALSQEAAGGFIRTEEVDEADGRSRMEKGDATALLVIPEGFAEAVLREEPIALELVTNPAERVLPGMVEEGLSILVDVSFYLHRLIGDDLREFAEGPPGDMDRFPDARIAEFSVEVNQLVERLSGYLSPLAIRLESGAEESLAEEDGEEEGGAARGGGLALFFLPGILFMALLFMAQGLAEDLWRERNQKTLRRVVVSPRSVHSFLLGKVLAGSWMMLIVSLVALSLGYAFFALNWRSLPLAVIWCALSGAVLMVGMMTVQLFATSQRAGSILSMALIFPLMMVGGSFFPFEAMPTWMASIGRLTPNGWALEQLKGVLFEQIDLASLALGSAGLIAVALLLFLLNARRLRASFALG